MAKHAAHKPLPGEDGVPADYPSQSGDWVGDPPTTVLPQVRGRRRRPPVWSEALPDALSNLLSDPRRRPLVLAGGVGGGVLVVVLLVGVLLSGGGDEPTTAAPVEETPSVVVTEAVDEPTEFATPLGEPTATPTTVRSTRPAASPTDLIAAIRAGLNGLVRDGQLEGGPARDLDKRLRDASRAIEHGDTGRALEVLREVTQRLRELREDDEISASGYQSMVAAVDQVSQSLSARR